MIQRYLHRKVHGYGNYEHQGFSYGDGYERINLGFAYVQRDFSDTIVEYEGKPILVVQVEEIKDGKFSKYVVVPGQVISRKGNISEVEPITDDRDKANIEKILKETMEGPLNFWSI